MDMVKILSHIEGDAVEHFARGVINEFEFYVLELTAHKFACSEVNHIASAEYWFVVSGTEWVETAHI